MRGLLCFLGWSTFVGIFVIRPWWQHYRLERRVERMRVTTERLPSGARTRVLHPTEHYRRMEQEMYRAEARFLARIADELDRGLINEQMALERVYALPAIEPNRTIR